MSALSPASRRAMLCGIASLAAMGGASASPASGSPALARLVLRYERFDRILDAGEDEQGWPDARLISITGRLRWQIAKFPATNLEDIKLKARSILIAYGIEGWAEEVAANLSGGTAYVDDVADSIALDLLRMIEAHA